MNFIFRTGSANFNFQPKQGLGIFKFLGHVSNECQDLLSKLIVYSPEERYSAKQALNHPYFKEFIDQENKMSKIALSTVNNLNMARSFHNMSQSIIKR
jgi:serine/threonine protein kinase